MADDGSVKQEAQQETLDHQVQQEEEEREHETLEHKVQQEGGEEKVQQQEGEETQEGGEKVQQHETQQEEQQQLPHEDAEKINKNMNTVTSVDNVEKVNNVAIEEKTNNVENVEKTNNVDGDSTKDTGSVETTITQRKELSSHDDESPQMGVSPSAILGIAVQSELQKLSAQDSQQLLFDYIISGQEKVRNFQELLVAQLEKNTEENVDILFRDNDSQATLMHKAARYNNVPVLDTLCKLGSNIEAEDFMNATPLMYSAASGSSKACHFLLSMGAMPNLRDKFQMSPLILAMKNGHIENAQILLVAGADIHFKGPRGATPLHLCCEEGKLEKVKFLLDNGAVITRTNQKSQSCLFAALRNQPTFQFIIDYMKSSSEGGMKSVVKQLLTRDDQTRTVFHLCVEEEHIETMHYLIALLKTEMPALYTQLLNDKEQLFGNTPLHLAAITNKLPLVQLLCSTAIVDVNAQNNNGNTALHIAIDNKNQLVAQYLTFVQKANTKVKNNAKLTPLQLAKTNKIEITSFTMAEQCGVDSSAVAVPKVSFCGCFGA